MGSGTAMGQASPFRCTIPSPTLRSEQWRKIKTMFLDVDNIMEFVCMSMVLNFSSRAVVVSRRQLKAIVSEHPILFVETLLPPRTIKYILMSKQLPGV